MKKFVFLCLLVCTNLFGFANIQIPQTVHAENSYYAKVQNTGVYLCGTPSETSALFEIPYSYFVKVESSVDDYFKVTYNEVSGYVKKDRVTLMNGTPENPYANSTFQIFVPYKLYETPSQTSSGIDVGTTNTFTYYGTKVGEQVSSTSNVWYYASTVVGGTTYFGYIFSPITHYFTPISTNNESFPIIDDLDLSSSPNSELKTLSTGTKIMLIVAISVPSVLILYFLIKPTKIVQITKSRKQIKKDRKKVHHGDYFEFDENDL